MVYDIRFTGPARKALEAVPPRIVGAIIEFVYGDLAREPQRVGKPLQRELAGLHGACRGPYRVLYRIDDDARTVFIVHVDHRSDVYRQW